MFFDYYIIPLAKKLNDCGVFGVSSDEYLNYALENRSEWKEKGKDIVANMARQVSEDVDSEPLSLEVSQQTPVTKWRKSSTSRFV